MQIFEVGKPFPFQIPNEGLKVLFSGESLHLRLVLDNPTQDETEDFLHGDITVGLFESDACPFIIPRCGDLLLGDCTMDATLEAEDKVAHFLRTPAEHLTGAMLFLVNLRSDILKAIRSVSYEVRFIEQMQRILAAQIENASTLDITSTINDVYEQYSVHELFEVSEHFTATHASVANSFTII